MAVALLLLAGLVAQGCSAGRPDSPPDTRAARQFDDFAVYWLGARFEKWKLTAVALPYGPEGFVSLIYGDCTPTGDDHPSCTPPVQVQISALCSHLREVARAPIWKQRRIRGAPVGTIDGAPVLFSRSSQVKVYRGEGTDAGVELRALRALRSLNNAPPVVGVADRIAPPARGVLAERSCGG